MTFVSVDLRCAHTQIHFISKGNYFMPLFISSWTLLPILQQNWKWKEDLFLLGLIKIEKKNDEAVFRKKINEPALIKNK